MSKSPELDRVLYVMKLTFVALVITLIVGCDKPPHPSDETFKTMTESCKQQGLVVFYYNSGTTVTLECRKAP